MSSNTEATGGVDWERMGEGKTIVVEKEGKSVKDSGKKRNNKSRYPIDNCHFNDNGNSENACDHGNLVCRAEENRFF